MRRAALLFCLLLAPVPATAKRAPKAPRAKKAADVQTLINGVLDGQVQGLQGCAIKYAISKGAKSVELAASVMINNFGQVMECTVVAKADEKPNSQLALCCEDVLKVAPFPKSREALISVQRTWKFSTT